MVVDDWYMYSYMHMGIFRPKQNDFPRLFVEGTFDIWLVINRIGVRICYDSK